MEHIAALLLIIGKNWIIALPLFDRNLLLGRQRIEMHDIERSAQTQIFGQKFNERTTDFRTSIFHSQILQVLMC